MTLSNCRYILIFPILNCSWQLVGVSTAFLSILISVEKTILDYFITIFKFFCENKLIKHDKLLPFNIKSINTILKYLSIYPS